MRSPDQVVRMDIAKQMFFIKSSPKPYQIRYKFPPLYTGAGTFFCGETVEEVIDKVAIWLNGRAKLKGQVDNE